MALLFCGAKIRLVLALINALVHGFLERVPFQGNVVIFVNQAVPAVLIVGNGDFAGFF